jgi:hypothetical protein
MPRRSSHLESNSNEPIPSTGEETIASRTRSRTSGVAPTPTVVAPVPRAPRAPRAPRIATPPRRSLSPPQVVLKEKTKSCVDFYKKLTQQKNLNKLDKIFSKLIDEAKFNTILDIVFKFNNDFKQIKDNILDCRFNYINSITPDTKRRRISNELKAIEEELTEFYMNFRETSYEKFNYLILNHDKNDNFKDSVSSEPLTQLEKDLKINQSFVFQGLNDNFKELENQLVRLTNIYAEGNMCINTYSKFFKNVIQILLTDDFIESSVILRPSLSHFTKYSKLAAFYVYWESFVKTTHHNFEKDELLLCNINRIMVRGYGDDLQRLAGIDVGGVSRDFITDVIEELKESDIFTCLKEKGEKIEEYYYIDPDFKFNDYFKESVTFMNDRLSDARKIDTNYDGERFKKNFFKFFGNLLSFLLINDFTLSFKLSSAILSTLVYEDINIFNESYHHQFYYLYYDRPDIYTSYKDFIKDPLLLKDFTFNANDMITDLESDNYDLTPDNFSKYLEKLAKYRFPPKTKPYYKAISEGFNNIIRSCFNIKPMPLSVVDKLISNTEITMDEVKQLKEAFIANMTEKIRSITNQTNSQNTIRVTSFINLALSGPFSVKNQDDNMELLTEEKYLDFVSRLLRFWSGWNHFKQTPELKYHIKIIDGRSKDSLPSSHTCFYQIDLPPYDNVQSCLDKLYMVVYNVETGIGLAGGSKRRIKGGVFRMNILKKKLQKYKSIILKKKMKNSKKVKRTYGR